MQKLGKLLFGLCALLAVLAGCSKSNPFQSPNWQPEYFGPLLNLDIGLDDLSQLKDVEATYSVSPVEFGIPGFAFGTVLNVSPIQGISIPATNFHINEYAHEVEMDSMMVTVAFLNTLPIAVDPGTILKVMDSSTQQTILQHIINEQVLPGSSYSKEIHLGYTKISSTLSVFIEEFSSTGGDQIVFQDQDLVISFQISNLSVQKAVISGGFDLQLESKIPLNIKLNEYFNGYTGSLSLFLENSLPVKAQVNLAFLDKDENLLFSLFPDSILSIPAPEIDINGQVISSSLLDLRQFLLIDSLPDFKQISYLKVDIIFNTLDSPAGLVLDRNNRFKALLAGHIKGEIIDLIN